MDGQSKGLLLRGLCGSALSDSSETNEKATSEMDAGNLDAALAHFERAIELDRGMVMLQRGQDTEAQREFTTAIELDSSLKPTLEKSVEQIIKTRPQRSVKRSP